MDPTIFLPANGKIVKQNEMFNLAMATCLEEKKQKSKFKPVKLLLKIDVMSHLGHGEEFDIDVQPEI